MCVVMFTISIPIFSCRVSVTPLSISRTSAMCITAHGHGIPHAFHWEIHLGLISISAICEAELSRRSQIMGWCPWASPQEWVGPLVGGAGAAWQDTGNSCHCHLCHTSSGDRHCHFLRAGGFGFCLCKYHCIHLLQIHTDPKKSTNHCWVLQHQKQIIYNLS